ncbi:MAG: glycoside hydrolase family 38 [Opitutaceae bacterium]|nr:glycoside hydrolase family 38 [Opitutaceae bacterium]MBP9913421.1 glycoside hydrolase family 38 [Opitutaceae bacterium]
MKKFVVHVIPNAHLDPVWLWDAREGLNEGVATCRTILNLMDANPDLTFIRGEAAIYEHIRRTDPPTFARILEKIRTGRWDAVGGSWIQPDTNLLDSETLCRHYDVGLRYFREKLGVQVKCGWQADSFGHTAGLPEVFAAGGIENFAFTRPPIEHFPLKTPAFWWHGRGGARILSYRSPIGWYGCERDEIPRRFDQLIPWSKRTTLRNVAVFIGLGNHGGGPSQGLVNAIRAWAAAHPEFDVRFAGLHSFFASLRRELSATHAPKIDAVHGELNFSMRGCYASVARFKYAYRRAEHELQRAERTTTLLQHAGLAPAPNLDPAWEAVLFNSFHDILPGSSIERAFDEQIDEVGAVRHTARDAAFRALNHLIGRVRITVPAVGADHPKAVPFLLWNPLPRPLRTFVELETMADYRPVSKYQHRAHELPLEVRVGGKRTAFQVLATEHESFGDLAWRKRILLPVTLPAAGWNIATVGWVEGATPPAYTARAVGRGRTIRNEFYQVSARPGSGGIQIQHRGRALFGARGLQLTTLADNWGSWGAMNEEPAGVRLTKSIGRWKITRVAVTESGPLRAALVVRLATAKAQVDLTLRLTAGAEEVAIDARVFTDLKAARIKLVLPGARRVECEVPGERVHRTTAGEIPVLRWLRARSGQKGFALASDVLAAYDLEKGDLRVTLARANRYARAENLDLGKEWWRPTVDRGELRSRLLLLPLQAPVAQAAELLTQPPIVTLAWENPTGTLPTAGTLARLTPDTVQLLALKSRPGSQTVDLRVRNPAATTLRPILVLAGKRYPLGAIPAGTVATFRLNSGRAAQRVPLGG